MSEEPKKRGRKRTTNLYFGPEEEKAVLEFLTTEDYNTRNRIYNKHLRAPLNKMIAGLSSNGGLSKLNDFDIIKSTS